MDKIPEINLTPPDDYFVEHEFEYPKCDLCREEIRSKYYFLIEPNNVCEDCLKEHYRLKTADYPQF